MEAISYTAARQNFKQTLDRVVDDRTPVTIVRQRGEPVVIMSLDDYNSIMETLHLLRSPRNAARLLEAIRDVDAGRNIIERELIEP